MCRQKPRSKVAEHSLSENGSPFFLFSWRTWGDEGSSPLDVGKSDTRPIKESPRFTVNRVKSFLSPRILLPLWFHSNSQVTLRHWLSTAYNTSDWREGVGDWSWFLPGLLLPWLPAGEPGPSLSDPAAPSSSCLQVSEVSWPVQTPPSCPPSPLAAHSPSSLWALACSPLPVSGNLWWAGWVHHPVPPWRRSWIAFFTWQRGQRWRFYALLYKIWVSYNTYFFLR